MKKIFKVWSHVLNLPALLPLFARLYSDRRVSAWLKIAAFAAFVYIVSPLDLIPDLLTGIGWLDDIIFALIVVQMFIENVPEEIVDDHCAALKISTKKLKLSAKQGLSDLAESFHSLYSLINDNKGKLIKRFASKLFEGNKDE